MLRGLDLFSGIGGITLALKEWVDPIAYCEIDTYCQAVLSSRMADESLPNSPIWGDVRTLSGVAFNGSVDIIYGGFPCQDISVAGNGKGLDGKRSGLFFEIVRLAKEIEPYYIFLENVPAITTRGGLRVVREIAEMGYDCRWCVISAASVGALHKRERWFILAHSKFEGLEGWKESGQEKITELRNICNANCCNSDSESGRQTYSNAESQSPEKETWRRSARQHWPYESREHWKKIVSEMGKCSDGLPFYVDRIKCLGNSVVPQQVREAFKILMGLS